MEDIDKKMFVINRFNLDYRDDVPMQFLMGVYQPEKITLPPPKEISPKEAFEKFRQEHLSSQWSKPFKLDLPIEISEIFGEYTQKEITTNISQEVIPDGNGMAYSDEWIVMQNRLLHAISHLTLDERRLILLIANCFVFSAKTTWWFCGGVGGSPLTNLKTWYDVALRNYNKVFVSSHFVDLRI